ncbi:triple tyrosine motif-containing protein [Dyadobacter sp. CY312]|uniref:triple tyrosine motif-containing protein n=1 Tax=Dyadobacter sp. CY312 TaxID=2907303 RepID=UPI001F23B165|nr:triple tyrosine motif-containing protein [Dyadobacter sp. CY312]MCE7041192.1 LuxR family transcriptional regulator [Dyadobacter sp. CY312]
MIFFAFENPGKLRLYSNHRLQTKRMCRISLLLFFALFSFAVAQETPPLINFTPQVYKAHQQNWAIDQSADNIIYAANSDGLVEYDGSSWKLYPLPDHQIIRSVLCDEVTIPKPTTGKTLTQNTTTANRIYVGGYAEFGYWQESATGQLLYHSLSKKAGFSTLKTEEIWHIQKTPDYIYFQSFSRIYRFDGKNLTEIKVPGNFMFMRYVHNRLLVQMIGKGLYELNNRTWTPVSGTDALASTIVSSILPLGENRILITTTKNGLFIYEDGKLIPWNIPIASDLKRNIINKAILLSPDSSYAIGTIQKGVYIISKDGVLKYQFNKENGLQNNTVLSLAEDKRNHLWIGMDKGIDLISISSPIISYQTNDNPLGSTYAAAVWRGNLYVGSNNGVFVKRWKSSEPFRSIPGLGGQTWFLKVINDQLLCGHNDATYRIEENGIYKISGVTGGWVLLPVKSGNDTLLLQGAYTGLHVYKKNKNNLWSYAYPVKSVPPLPIRQLVQDSDGSFWLAHAYKGLYRAKLTPTLDSAIFWKEYRSPKEIPSEFSIEINKTRGKILVRSGSKYYEPDSTKQLHIVNTFQSTPEEPFKIREGIHGEWFKIFMNRVEFYSGNGEKKNFELTLVRNSETILPLSESFYFFCLDNGYALYDRLGSTRQIPENILPSVRRVSNLRNLSETFAIKSGVTLPEDIRSIRIAYSLPVFGQNIQFKYRLKGLTEQWSEWTDQNTVEFTNLDAGSYVFEIRSNLSNNIAAYQFSVTPYWRETFWAKLLFWVTVTVVLLALLLYQERRLERHRRKLLEEQEEKLRQQRLSSERKIMEIQNEKLQSEIKNKSQQISNVAINVVRKNEILEEIRDELKQVKLDMGQQLPNIHYQKLLNSIERNVAGKEDWQLFEDNFEEIHEQFFKRLRTICPAISPSELRLAACLRMNLSTKEMAPALGISIRGVEIKRYRLRKKLDLGLDANLVQYMMDI